MSESSALRFFFTRTPTFTSRFIQFFDGGHWSHVLVGSDGDAHAYDASMGTGVSHQTVDNICATRPDRCEMVLKVPDAAAGIAWAQSVVGSGYDDWSVVEQGIRKVFGTSFHAEKPGTWFCDEFAGHVAFVAGAALVTASGQPLQNVARNVGVEAFRVLLLAAGAVVVPLSVPSRDSTVAA